MAKTYPNLSNILKTLLFQRDMKPTDLARALHIPQPTVHRLVVGKSKRPFKSSLLPIADYFSITVEQLLGEKPLPPTVASNDILVNQAAKGTRSIPILPWKASAIESRPAKKDIPMLTVTNINIDAFALNMADSSMEPLFPRGSTLIFDPTITPKDRSYVLVKLHDSDQLIFRQLLIDADDYYLKPLNPDLSTFKMRSLHKNDKILANLIEARLDLRSQED